MMKRRWFLTVAFLLPLLSVSTARSDDVTVRWDIVHLLTSFTPPHLTAGGSASAKAEDLSQITLTGSGTFQLGEDSEVTGGGTWDTFSPSGAPTGMGTYVVTGLIKFDVAPGSLSGVVDLIGPAGDAHSGLAFLRIRYSDGSRGVLTVSCHLAVGTPNSIFEGITASKGFVDYWDHSEPVPNVDGNRTAFHFINNEGEQR
jgi:hypothetical protein